LGVCLEKAAWPLGALPEFANPSDIAVSDEIQKMADSDIQWASATWDGERVTVECKYSGASKLTVEIRGGSRVRACTRWGKGRDACVSALMAWRECDEPPVSAVLACSTAQLCIPVADLRSAGEIDIAALDAFDPDELQRIRDDLLLEQYGGLGDDDPAGQQSIGNVDAKKLRTGDKPVASTDYAIWPMTLARRHLDVVDAWTATRGTRRDADLLAAAFERRACTDAQDDACVGIGARMAAEELRLRRAILTDGA
jgi:hypothetical protein